MLLKASWARWQEREHLLGARGRCPRQGSGAARARLISGNRAVTQHIWARLPQNRWELVGASAGESEPWP